MYSKTLEKETAMTVFLFFPFHNWSWPFDNFRLSFFEYLTSQNARWNYDEINYNYSFFLLKCPTCSIWKIICDRAFYTLLLVKVQKMFVCHFCTSNKNPLKVCGWTVLWKKNNRRNFVVPLFPLTSDVPHQQIANQHWVQLCINWPNKGVI